MSIFINDQGIHFLNDSISGTATWPIVGLVGFCIWYIVGLVTMVKEFRETIANDDSFNFRDVFGSLIVIFLGSIFVPIFVIAAACDRFFTGITLQPIADAFKFCFCYGIKKSKSNGGFKEGDKVTVFGDPGPDFYLMHGRTAEVISTTSNGCEIIFDKPFTLLGRQISRMVADNSHLKHFEGLD